MDLVTSLDFIQHVKYTTHICGNTVGLVFTQGTDAEVLSTLQVPVSDHSCIFSCIFFSVSSYTTTKCSVPKSYTYPHIYTTAKLLFPEHPPNILDSCNELSASLDTFTDNLNSALRKLLDSVTPLTTKKSIRMKSAPWFTEDTRALKQTCRKFERQWRETKQESPHYLSRKFQE